MAARTSTKGKKSPGRPPLLFRPEITTAIVEAIEMGNYVETAVQYAGVSKSTFYNWMDRGTSERDRLLANPDAEPNPTEVPFMEFVDAVEKASAKAEVRNVAIIQKAAPTTWQAAAWWLERTRGRKYARKMDTEISGPDGGGIRIDVSTEDLERKVARILEKRSEA